MLIAIPCADGHKDNNIHKVSHSQNTSDNQQDCNDQCSPFCTCSCCVTFVITQDYVVLFKSYSFFSDHAIIYAPVYVSSFSNAIWKPPKLS